MFRASILPYIIHEGQLYLGLGLDSRYKEITDFGGRVDFYDKDHYSTALREFQEETSSPIDFKQDGMISIKNDMHQIYLCKTERYIMHNYIQHISNLEISKGFIIRWDNFLKLLDGESYQGYKMWDSLRDVLKSKLEDLILPVEKSIHSS